MPNHKAQVLAPQPDRVAIVTGGTDGIGYSTAKHLARLGMHVIIAGNNAGKAQDVVRQIQEETLNDKETSLTILTPKFHSL
uniref:Uncharacterized protein n=1 Tax=Ursus americanus TaxID=9643 RepID=A0A452RRD2_URSAM